jgi:hypothetical protein
VDEHRFCDDFGEGVNSIADLVHFALEEVGVMCGACGAHRLGHSMAQEAGAVRLANFDKAGWLSDGQ